MAAAWRLPWDGITEMRGVVAGHSGRHHKSEQQHANRGFQQFLAQRRTI
jgi:hypothetical protein